VFSRARDRQLVAFQAEWQKIKHPLFTSRVNTLDLEQLTQCVIFSIFRMVKKQARELEGKVMKISNTLIAALALMGLSTAQPTLAAPSESEKILQATSTQEIQAVLITHAEQLEQLAKSPNEKGQRLDEESQMRLLVLAEQVRQDAKNPGIKKKLLKTLKRGGKGVVVGVGYVGYTAFDVATSPLVAIFSFMDGVVSGDTPHAIAKRFHGSAFFSSGDGGAMAAFLDLTFAAQFIEIPSAPLSAGIIIAMVSASAVEGKCHGKTPPPAEAKFTQAFCKGTRVIDNIIARPVAFAAGGAGSAIHNAIEIIFNNLGKETPDTPPTGFPFSDHNSPYEP